VNRVTSDGKCLFRSLAMLLQNISCYFLLIYLFSVQKQCYAVLSIIAKSVEIQRAVTLIKLYSPDFQNLKEL
jgi:ABC-type iron transport system FetAB permease component